MDITGAERDTIQKTPPHLSMGKSFLIQTFPDEIAGWYLLCIVLSNVNHMIDYKIKLVISYEQYVPIGINNWTTYVRDYETEIDRSWSMEDALCSFRTYYLPKFGKIISIRKKFLEINKSRNHHNRIEEIVL